MIGAKGPKMLRLAALHADIWSWYVEERSDLEEFGPRLAALEAACVEVGRDPATIGRSAGIVVEPTSVTGSAERARRRPSAARPRRSPTAYGASAPVASPRSRSCSGHARWPRSRRWARLSSCSTPTDRRPRGATDAWCRYAGPAVVTAWGSPRPGGVGELVRAHGAPGGSRARGTTTGHSGTSANRCVGSGMPSSRCRHGLEAGSRAGDEVSRAAAGEVAWRCWQGHEWPAAVAAPRHPLCQAARRPGHGGDHERLGRAPAAGSPRAAPRAGPRRGSPGRRRPGPRRA